MDIGEIASAEVTAPCPDPDAAAGFLVDRLGFRVESVLPADDPAVVVVAGHGLRLRLDRDAAGPPPAIRIRLGANEGRTPGILDAPGGLRIELVAAVAPAAAPPLQPAFVVARGGGAAAFRRGRAGMEYRDLIPGRQGGRFIASHIRIPRGGPVGDWTHFHVVAFQVIVCVRGRVRVVYEDQGPPFWLEAGDAVLQPPGIRHRVLECGSGLEVVEVASPAAHETRADHALALPTPRTDPGRLFGGQRFVCHVAADAPWTIATEAGFEARDLGLATPSAGAVSGRVLRAAGPGAALDLFHAGELRFGFVLAGRAALRVPGEAGHDLAAGDAFALPPGRQGRLTPAGPGFELLEFVAPPSLR